MTTLFAVYNLKEDQQTDRYDNYLVETKIPGIRGAPWCSDFKTWKIDKVLGPAVSKPEGTLPNESPYHYIAKIEVNTRDKSKLIGKGGRNINMIRNLARRHHTIKDVQIVRPNADSVQVADIAVKNGKIVQIGPELQF